MKSLRFRLAIVLSVFFTVVLAIAFYIIYIMYADFRQEVFYKRLKDKAITTLRLLVDVEKIDHDLLKEIDRNTLNSLFEEKVLIFESGKLIYSSIDDNKIDYNSDLLYRIKAKKEITITQGNNELTGMYVERNNKGYVLIASAFDKYGKGKLEFLKGLLIVVYMIGLVAALVGTYLVVTITIKPLEKLKTDLEKIGYNNLHVRLTQNGQVDEINSLASNINQMVERLEKSSSIQRDFIHYASHELRTPLAAMISITENAMHHNYSQLHLMKAMQDIFQQQKALANITNSLLFLSDSKLAQEGLEYSLVRLDEMVFHTVEIMKNYFPGAEIAIQLEGDVTNENYFMVSANKPLIMIAFNNLLKNALQYSLDKSAKIEIHLASEQRQVKFINKGNPVNEEDVKRIFTPFYRSANASVVKGSGLGLALVSQAAKLNNAEIVYLYEEGNNVFNFIFRQGNTLLASSTFLLSHGLVILFIS